MRFQLMNAKKNGKFGRSVLSRPQKSEMSKLKDKFQKRLKRLEGSLTFYDMRAKAALNKKVKVLEST